MTVVISVNAALTWGNLTPTNGMGPVSSMATGGADRAVNMDAFALALLRLRVDGLEAAGDPGGPP